MLAENDLDDYTLSSPAISDGHIFMRTTAFLYAIGNSCAGLPRRLTDLGAFASAVTLPSLAYPLAFHLPWKLPS